MKIQAYIISYVIVSTLIFSFFLIFSFIWTSSISTIGKLSKKENLEYFKEILEASMLLQLSNCNFCFSNITLRIPSILSKETQPIVIFDSINFILGEDKISSNFYNFSTYFEINALAQTSKNIVIYLNSLEKKIKIEN